MTLTIAARWRVTFAVQSLARVSLPPRAAAPPRVPDYAAYAAALRTRDELASERFRWETELYLSTMRRMY